MTRLREGTKRWDATRSARGSAGLAVVAIAAMLLLAGCSGEDDPTVSAPPAATGQGLGAQSPQADEAGTDHMAGGGTGGGTGGDMAAEAPRVPPVFGYYGGKEVFFIHTEVSDAEIA